MIDQGHRTPNRFRLHVFGAVLLWTLVALSIAPAAAEDNMTASPWGYDVVLYGWLSGLDGEVGMGPVGQEVSASFDDLLGFVDFAISGHFEAKNDDVLLLADVSYVGLGAEREAEIARQMVDLELDIDQWIFEFGGGWRFTPELDLVLVGRYYVLDTGATSESIAGNPSGGSTEDWGDVFLGARYSRYFMKKWLFSVRGDLGAGGSDFAWFGNVALGYQFTSRFSVLASWRVLSLDHTGDSSDDYFEYDITQDGPGVGLRFSF